MNIEPKNRKQIQPGKSSLTHNPLAIGYRLLAIA
jgi:hypothetical protein